MGEALGDIPDNLSGNADLGWLGGKDRLTEHFGSVRTIQMGQRQYVPGLGRFLEVDPVEGGSANDYDYCDADPIGCVDLDGTFGIKRLMRRVADVASFVAVIPGPVGMVASGIAVGGYLAAGEPRKAAVAAIGLVPGGGALTMGFSAAKNAKRLGGAVKKGYQNTKAFMQQRWRLERNERGAMGGGSEHRKNKRKSTANKHQRGQARKKADQQRKADRDNGKKRGRRGRGGGSRT